MKGAVAIRRVLGKEAGVDGGQRAKTRPRSRRRDRICPSSVREIRFAGGEIHLVSPPCVRAGGEELSAGQCAVGWRGAPERSPLPAACGWVGGGGGKGLEREEAAHLRVVRVARRVRPAHHDGVRRLQHAVLPVGPGRPARGDGVGALEEGGGDHPLLEHVVLGVGGEPVEPVAPQRALLPALGEEGRQPALGQGGERGGGAVGEDGEDAERVEQALPAPCASAGHAPTPPRSAVTPPWARHASAAHLSFLTRRSERRSLPVGRECCRGAPRSAPFQRASRSPRLPPPPPHSSPAVA